MWGSVSRDTEEQDNAGAATAQTRNGEVQAHQTMLTYSAAFKISRQLMNGRCSSSLHDDNNQAWPVRQKQQGVVDETIK